MKKIISIIFILLTFSLISYAQFETGNSLYHKFLKGIVPSSDMETNLINFQESAFAMGYAIAIMDLCNDHFFSAPKGEAGITETQVRDIAMKYLEKHPESRHKPATVLLIEAFKEAFPSKKEEDEKER